MSKWIVSLNDGTSWAELDSLPIVIEVTEEFLEQKKLLTPFPFDGDEEWDEAELKGDILTHIHVQDLLNQSHWADHENVREGTIVEILND
jgi:hypothetical protein